MYRSRWTDVNFEMGCCTRGSHRKQWATQAYRIDANYRARGFEGLNQDDRWSERVRRIHFANIPPKCIISIFSLDGDLVREIHHNKDPNDPTSRHAEWGLISRNGLRVVSGMYYWVVESDSRTEMGKLVIIL